MTNFFSIILFILVLGLGCTEQSKNKHFKKPISKKDLKINHVKLDSIQLDSIDGSYTGFSKIIRNQIFFIDERLGKVYIFDKNGSIKNQALGRGKGPNEFPGGEIDAFCSLDNNYHMFIDGSASYFIFNKEWEREENSYINWNIKHSKSKRRNNPTADMSGIYAPVYEKFILRSYRDYAYFPILSNHPDFNFTNSEDYYKNGRIIAKLNINTSKIEGLLGRHSPIYLQDYDGNIGQFSLINFDITDNGSFYVSHEADSCIYLYNNNFEIQEAFGYKGRDMNTEYNKITNEIEFKRNYEKDRNTYGYYCWVEYFDEKQLLFRNYKKGKHARSNGLQIYKNKTLIGDIDVPEDFNKVIGYIEPYFYSNIFFDEKFEKMKIYRFKIK